MTGTHRTRTGLVILAAALAFLPSCDSNDADDTYLPETDDTAILFIHQFNPDDYGEGKDIVIDGFSEAIEVSGQTRRTYFLSRSENAEVLAISFFHASSNSDEWLNSEVRDDVLDQLRPLYREPLDVREYHAELIHNVEDDDKYLADEGDELVLFIHLFTEEGYEEGKAKVVDEFPQNIEVAGQNIRSYFFDRPDNNEVVVASFVHPDSDADVWLEHEEHRETLEGLDSLHRQPLVVARYVLEDVHNAN